MPQVNAQAAAIRQTATQLMQAGRFQEAVVQLQQAAGLDPESVETFGYLGAAYARLKNFESARRAFGRAVQLNPGSAKARFNLGTAHQMAGDTDSARVCYESAVNLDPNYQQAQDALAKLPPKVVHMADLANPGAMHLPGAQASGFGDAETGFQVSHLTPEEIARLSMPSGKMHLPGAQAGAMGDDAAAEPQHAWTQEEIARLSMPEGGHIHMMGAQAEDDKADH